MPRGMIERPILRLLAPFARVVDQDHGEDRGAAENIERQEAAAASVLRIGRRPLPSARDNGALPFEDAVCRVNFAIGSSRVWRAELPNL